MSTLELVPSIGSYFGETRCEVPPLRVLSAKMRVRETNTLGTTVQRRARCRLRDTRANSNNRTKATNKTGER